jgi:membrane protein required for colicin V production
MTPIDLLMIAVILLSAATAFNKGLLLELFSLAGVVLGLIIAAAGYGLLVPWMMQWVERPKVADLSAFLAIALGVQLAVGLIGRLLRGALRWAGLGFLDRLLGALFGVVKGCALVTLAVMAVAAFLPSAPWLKNSRLAPPFLAAAHEGSHIAPEFGGKTREWIRQMHIAQPQR